MELEIGNKTIKITVIDAGAYVVLKDTRVVDGKDLDSIILNKTDLPKIIDFLNKVKNT